MKVTSSNIAEVDYDEDTNELIVTFHNGAVYVYSDVPKTLYDEFIDTDSPGKFLHLNVKDRFTFRKEK